MTKFVNIKSVFEAAKAAGFTGSIQYDYSYCELHVPDKTGPHGVWNFDSLYSTAEIILSDTHAQSWRSPVTKTPHPGLEDAGAPNLIKLLSHPAMSTYVPEYLDGDAEAINAYLRALRVPESA